MLLLAGAGACGPDGPTPPEPSPSPPAHLAEPVGAEAYRQLLLREAGVGLSPEALARRAQEDADTLDTVLDALAARVEPGAADWRPVFEGLRRDHPPDGPAVVEVYRREVEAARRFVEARGLVTLPENPMPGPLVVEETPDTFPAGKYPLVAYIGNRLAVTTDLGSPEASRRQLLHHCRVCIAPFAVHETYPGHHVGFLHQRRPKEAPSPELLAFASEHFKNRFFYEGWGQTAELLMLEAGYYDGDPARELGAWRLVYLRAVRAAMDPLLHTGALSPEEAIRRLEEDLLLEGEAARAEVAHHLREPTMKTSYWLGARQILALRRALETRETEPLGPPAFYDRASYDRAFYDRLLEWPMPLPEAARRRFGAELTAEETLTPALADLLRPGTLPEPPSP